MKTKIIKLSQDVCYENVLDEACDYLKRGELVAFPTETVYGLGGDGLRADASQKIYSAKGRPSDNPLIIHIAEMDMLKKIVLHIPENAERLAKRFWPGPLTMIFEKTNIVPFETTGGLSTVAVRMPAHKAALALIKKSGIYIAAPSANLSGRPSPTTAEHVMEDMDGRISCIIDGGHAGIGIESTIIDMTEDIPMILRPGFITEEMIKEVIKDVKTDPAVLSQKPDITVKAKAPGMKYKHYAPHGELCIVKGDIRDVIKKILLLAYEKHKEKKKVAIIATDETYDLYKKQLQKQQLLEDYDDITVRVIGSRHIEGSIAAGLYDILRYMDEIGAEYIYTEDYESDALGVAVMNRLIKAAGYNLIYAGDANTCGAF